MYRQLDELVRAASSMGPVKVAVAAGHDPDVIEAMKQAQEMIKKMQEAQKTNH